MAHRIYTTSFGSVYPHYVTKVTRKGRTEDELREVIEWHTGYDRDALARVIEDGTHVEAFFADAPRLNPDRDLVTGVICGVRVEEIEEPTMREIRILDKLVDELARGKAMAKVLRTRA